MNGRFDRHLLTELQDKQYREAFVESHTRTGPAYQIRVMRESRGWSQEELANRIDSSQSVVARVENPDYGKFSLTTLLKFASAFDVALLVRFVTFSELLERTSNLTPEALDAVSFSFDKRLHQPHHLVSADDLERYISQPSAGLQHRPTMTLGWLNTSSHEPKVVSTNEATKSSQDVLTLQ